MPLAEGITPTIPPSYKSGVYYKNGKLVVVKNPSQAKSYSKGKVGVGSRPPKKTVPPKSPPKKSPPKPAPKTSSTKTTQEKVEQSFREKEFVIEGIAKTIAHPNYISNATIKLQNIGKVLSGTYYVEMVRHVWNREGYMQELELKSNSYNGFKYNQQNKKVPPANQNSTRPPKPKVPPKTNPPRIYIVKKGDNLWSIARKYYGKGSLYTRIAQANKLKNPNLIYPGQKLIIP